MNRRRRIRRRPAAHGGKKIQVNFTPIIVIICLSVCAGYLTAKYVVYPILGYEPTGLSILKEKTTKENKDAEKTEQSANATSAAETTAETTAPAQTTATQTPVVEDQVEVGQSGQTAGYALQFGSYSTEAAAKKSVKQLKNSGIEAQVVEKGGAYKVIGQLYDTKEKARNALAKMDESIGAFVTTVEK